jgi:O-antigen/teichoic acid export membrane protein
MRQQLRQLSGDTAIYGITTIVQRLLSFLLTPFYTWILTPQEFGLQANVFAMIAFLMVIANAGMEAAFFRFESAAESEEEKRRVFWNAIAVNWAVAAILAGILVALPGLSSTALFLGVGPEAYDLVRYTGIIIFLDSASTVAMASLRMERRAKTFGAIKVAAIVVNVALNILLVPSMRVEGVFHAGIFQSATLFLLTLPILARKRPPSLDRGALDAMVRFGLPTIASSLGAVALQVIDRPIIVALAGEKAAGLYQAGFRLAMPMMMFVAMFEFAWRPFFLQQASKPNARELYARIFTYFNVVAAAICLVVSFFVVGLAALPIPFRDSTVIGRAFWEGLEIVPTVLAAYVFSGWYTNFIVGIYIEKKTAAMPWITGLGALVKAGLCFLLVPLSSVLALHGGAIATLVAYVVMATTLLLYVQRYYAIPYEWGRVARALGLALLLWGVHALLVDFFDRSVQANLIRLGLLLAYPLLLFVSGFFNQGERRELRRLILRQS